MAIGGIGGSHIREPREPSLGWEGVEHHNKWWLSQGTQKDSRLPRNPKVMTLHMSPYWEATNSGIGEAVNLHLDMGQ